MYNKDIYKPKYDGKYWMPFNTETNEYSRLVVHSPSHSTEEACQRWLDTIAKYADDLPLKNI